MGILRKYSAYVIYGAAGALGGLLYWKFVGCVDGDCAISSSAMLSSVYGMIIGLFATNSLKGIIGKSEMSNENEGSQR